MLRRRLLTTLLEWRDQPERKPILINGARQVGKTFLLERLFGQQYFADVHILDFAERPGLTKIFDEDLDPQFVIERMELALGKSIDLDKDLLIFDEIGECQRALDSLKYFAEKAPTSFVVASGSNIGLLPSFPVGKVEVHELTPLCFEEFLMASGDDRLINAYDERRTDSVTHDRLWSMLLDHFFVGGMPEAVFAWFTSEESLLQRTQRINSLHRNLITGFRNDFGKYVGKIPAQEIDTVFTSVPLHLYQAVDQSVTRYQFKDVLPSKNRYQQLQSPIEWLESARLIHRNYVLKVKPTPPFQVQRRENIFKLYFFDLGLLSHMLDLSYSDHHEQHISYRGFVAENFVQLERNSYFGQPSYSWQTNQAEIEFLHTSKDRTVIPIEVKSESQQRAKSLDSYVQRYKPKAALKLARTPVRTKSGVIETWPLYYTEDMGTL